MPKSPLVSFCLLTYNQERFILDALKGAFSQTYANLEIIISDDSSTDKTYLLIEEAVANYKGPHKIIVNRNSQNLGIAQHVNKVLYELANGDFLMLAAGDDVSLPSRTQVCVDFLLSHPEVSSVSLSSEECNQNLQRKVNTFRELITPGRDSIFTLEDYVYFDNFIIFPGDSRVLRREVINTFPPLKYVSAEDLTLFYRSILIGSVGYIRQPLVKYRIYGGNETCKREIDADKLRRNRENTRLQLISDLKVAIEKGYLDVQFSSLIQKKIDCLIMWLYGYETPSPQHSSTYNNLKKAVRSIAKFIFRE